MEARGYLRNLFRGPGRDNGGFNLGEDKEAGEKRTTLRDTWWLIRRHY